MRPRPPIRPRVARLPDLDGLLALEAGFPGDRMNRRQYRWHINNPRASLRVLVVDGRQVASSLCFFRAASDCARLYSLVVAADRRGGGLGAAMLADAEREARRRGCLRMRLEVRADNPGAIGLYRAAGFVQVGELAGYYQDGAAGLRLEKRLAPGARVRA